MLHWVLKQNGMIRLVNMNYHGEGVDTKERLFNVGENIHFEAELEEYDAKREHWQPFITNDLQIELVMLDPWVRTTLTHLKDRTYVADFTVPSS